VLRSRTASRKAPKLRFKLRVTDAAKRRFTLTRKVRSRP
jgi:hypothetical protein